MKTLLTTLLALTITGPAAAESASHDALRQTSASIPACYQRPLEALETALKEVKRNVRRTCKSEGLTGFIDDLAVTRNNDCQGFDVTATFVCN